MNSTESVLPVCSPMRRLTAVLLAVLCAGYAVGAGIGWGSCELSLVMGDFGLAAAALAAALSCLAHGIAVGGHTRPAWLLFGLSSAMVAFGNAAWGWYEVVLGRPLPPDSYADFAFLLFAPLAITGLLVLAQRPRNPAGWLCLVLDAWLVAGSLFTLSWSLALGRVAAGDGDDPLKLALGLGYPVLDILLVSLVVGLNVRGRDRNRAAVHTAMIGLAVTVVCDALFTTPQFHSDYHSGELLDAGWFAGSLLLAWAPWSHTRRPSREHPSTQGVPRRRVASTFSALTPYAAAAVCTAGILYNALGGRPLDRVMLAAASTVGLALIVRQGVMLLDNLSLAQELATKEAHFRSLVQGSSDVIMIAGPSGALSYVSPAALRVYNRDPEDLVGGNLLNLVHPEDVDRVLAEVRRILARTKGARFSNGEPSARVECRIRSGEGEWLHVESTVNPYRDGLILNSRDITERVRLQAQLQHNAFHDPLTDLPNRALFAHRVRAALSAQGPAGTAVAVLFLDLDGFKAVNDTAGHQVGDELLVQAARRLQAAVRTEDTVARFGGDEFAVLVRGRLGHPQVRDLAERIRAALSEPYWIGGAELGVAASIGIAFGPDTPLPVPEPAPDDDPARPAPPNPRPPAPPTNCSATPTWRCTRPSPAARAGSCSTPRPCAPNSTGAANSRSGCAPPSAKAPSHCSTSPSSTWPAAGSPASRRRPAGAPPRACCSPPPSSCAPPTPATPPPGSPAGCSPRRSPPPPAAAPTAPPPRPSRSPSGWPPTGSAPPACTRPWPAPCGTPNSRPTCWSWRSPGPARTRSPTNSAAGWPRSAASGCPPRSPASAPAAARSARSPGCRSTRSNWTAAWSRTSPTPPSPGRWPATRSASAGTSAWSPAPTASTTPGRSPSSRNSAAGAARAWPSTGRSTNSGCAAPCCAAATPCRAPARADRAAARRSPRTLARAVSRRLRRPVPGTSTTALSCRNGTPWGVRPAARMVRRRSHQLDTHHCVGGRSVP
ncbi:putative signaling protein [Kitasatospora cheerisanensis KCTC 2395]|uniref:Putative signaling protein n=1 Tax=Kitasatospora cheerisanensis KCTC 2395 TaxID=1348663 RepID=A0A066YY45_9ACTN|nr:putative signaling protein [Kitasatospora cheerisanensis KCTC 2395]